MPFACTVTHPEPTPYQALTLWATILPHSPRARATAGEPLRSFKRAHTKPAHGASPNLPAETAIKAPAPLSLTLSASRPSLLLPCAAGLLLLGT